MKHINRFFAALAVTATGMGAVAQTADERAYQIAEDQNACQDRPILSARFTDETETEVEVRCAAGALAGKEGLIAAGATLLIVAALASGSDGDSSSDTQ